MSTIIKRQNISEYDLGSTIKRCYLPFDVTAPCPKCGHSHTIPLSEHYLSYPIFGKPSYVYFSCEENKCADDVTEFQVSVILDVTLTLAKDVSND